MDDDDLSDVESVHDYDTSLQEKGLQNCNKLPVEITEPIKTLGIIEKVRILFYIFFNNCPHKIFTYSYGNGHNLYRKMFRLYCKKVIKI